MRARITVLGVVQGVGFRPFVAECARALSIRGSVCNSGGVVRIEAYGTKEAMEELVHRLRSCAPPAARVDQVIVESGEASVGLPSDSRGSGLPSGSSESGLPSGCSGCGMPHGSTGSAGSIPDAGQEPEEFRIVESEAENGADLPLIPPDLPICEDCLSELHDPLNRRFRYPFISCTSCGPRYSILEAIPYDREHISMRDYTMCPECGREYRQPGGRRQHAQTISCRKCGPQLILSKRESFSAGGSDAPEKNIESDREPASAGSIGLTSDAALREAVHILKEGGILAVKGVGGYQLACLPDREETVRRLRLLKGREKKPFAVMFPSMDGGCGVRAFCTTSPQEEALLTSPARPIVLLERKEGRDAFCPSLCAESRYLGAFLPYTGLHQLLTEEAGPLVMTSANRTDDPIFTEEEELEELWAQFPELLGAAAWNTRRIVTPLDDSLMRITAGHVQMLRRSRGFVPSPVFFAKPRPEGGEKERKTVLAFGGDLKAVFCLAAGERAYLSQYFGDMENFRVYQTYRKELSRMEELFGIRPQMLVCDLHPGYMTTQLAEMLAEETGRPLLHIQHHHAHAASVMAEHGLEQCIGVVFDGTGYGTDGCIWGGEFLVCEGASFRRMGHLEEILLVGGDASAKDASLTAACHLAALPEADENTDENVGKNPEEKEADRRRQSGGRFIPETAGSRMDFVEKALKSRISLQCSSSMGRLFDAVSALLEIRSFNSYEGECAIALENAAWQAAGRPAGRDGRRMLPFPVREEGDMLIADRRALLSAMLRELEKETEETEAEKEEAEKEEAEKEEGRVQKKAPLPKKTPAQREELAQELALAFHEAAAEMVLAMCRKIREKTGIGQIALSGGVFANVLLQERCRTLLEGGGFSVYVNEQVPGNDGGICLGQAWLALRERTQSGVNGKREQSAVDEEKTRSGVNEGKGAGQRE